VNYLVANFAYAYTAFLKVMSHQCFADADAAVLTVFRLKATVQTLVSLPSITMAIAR